MCATGEERVCSQSVIVSFDNILHFMSMVIHKFVFYYIYLFIIVGVCHTQFRT